MKRLTALCVPFFVIACQSVPEPKRVEIVQPPKVEVVKVAVVQPCINKADLPASPRPTSLDLKKASHAQVAAAAALDLRAQDEYVAKLQAVIAPCLH